MPIEVSMSLFETPTLFFPFFNLGTCLVFTEDHNKNILKKQKVSQVLSQLTFLKGPRLSLGLKG
jgi:hypothetical protein